MSSITEYRRKHPEFREKEKVKDNEYQKAKYNNNLEHKEKVKQRALERYYRLKAEKLKNTPIEVS